MRPAGDVIAGAIFNTTDEPKEISREAAEAVLRWLLDEGYHLIGTPTWTDIEEQSLGGLGTKTLRLEGSLDALRLTSQHSTPMAIADHARSTHLFTAMRQSVIRNYLFELGKLLGLTPLVNENKGVA